MSPRRVVNGCGSGGRSSSGLPQRQVTGSTSVACACTACCIRARATASPTCTPASSISSNSVPFAGAPLAPYSTCEAFAVNSSTNAANAGGNACCFAILGTPRANRPPAKIPGRHNNRHPPTHKVRRAPVLVEAGKVAFTPWDRFGMVPAPFRMARSRHWSQQGVQGNGCIQRCWAYFRRRFDVPGDNSGQ